MSTTTTLNLKNIQGDIIIGLPKRQQIFLFFQIRKPVAFRQRFGQHILPIITTTANVLEDRKKIKDHQDRHLPGLVPLVGTNVAFSSSGLRKLGIDPNLDLAQDDANNRQPIPNEPGPFTLGQLADAEFLGDPGAKQPTTADPNHYEPEWRDEFKHPIHGVFLITGDNWERVEARSDFIERVFKIDNGLDAAIVEVLRIRGQVRPEPFKGHEHFGFEDGISNPTVKGLEKIQNMPVSPLPSVDPGILLVGRDGDKQQETRPAWAKDGSFLVFRQLDQLVPEFDQFLDAHADEIHVPGHPKLTHEQKKELLGARLVGRWKSGAPIDLAPVFDDKNLAQDPKRVNNFSFLPNIDSQLRCPFHAHIRKTMPRADLASLNNPPTPNFGILDEFRIMRAGITYGPEVTDEEQDSHTTQSVRGLAFVCYQSDISSGFRFIQHSWADTKTFPPKPTEKPAGLVSGLDPIIGQQNVNPAVLAVDPTKDDHDIVGAFPDNDAKTLTVPREFVVTRGGEYFFSPSLEALSSTKFSLPPPIVPDHDEPPAAPHPPPHIPSYNHDHGHSHQHHF